MAWSSWLGVLGSGLDLGAFGAEVSSGSKAQQVEVPEKRVEYMEIWLRFEVKDLRR